MNWKNITLEVGFVKQEINFNRTSIVNYIPLNQVDSFGIVNSENKRWLYAAIFVGACSLLCAFGSQFQMMAFTGVIACGLAAVYYFTKKTWFAITSSQTKMNVEVLTTKEELQSVNAFVINIKEAIHKGELHSLKQAA